MIKIRYLTVFEFFKNTPFTDLKNTIYFKNDLERSNFFDNMYEKITVEQPFNFIKDRFSIRVKGDYKDFREVNYCRFSSEFEPDVQYYCFIPEYKYINDDTIELNLLVDGIMTFCQGDVLNDLKGLTVHRQHLTDYEYYKNLEYLKNNNDVIKTNTKKYFYDKTKEFDEFNVLIHSSVDLNGDFGNVDDPNIDSPSGSTFDKITSPVDLYIVSEDNFYRVMDKLKSFPWVTQNFTKIALIPKEVIDLDVVTVQSEPVNNNTLDLSDVHKITGGLTEFFPNYFDELNLTNSELLNLFSLDEQHEHILRNEYTTIELYNWNGEQVLLDAGQLDRDTGIKLDSVAVGGYTNELAVYPENYKARENSQGSFLNDSLFFRDFDDVPILIDNYSLALSQNANQREVAESNLLTGRVDRILSPENDLQDRLASSVAILTNLNPINIGQQLVDEHEFYRQQKAQNMDLALKSPTIKNQSYNYSLNKRNNFFGVNMKMSKPSPTELEKIKKYYCLYGYEVEDSNTELSDTRSMSVLNYVQFEGNFNIPKMERSMLDVLKIRFENGVRLWHNAGIPNPFNQRVLNNERVI